MACYVNTCIACIAHVIQPLLVTSAKWCGYPCSAGSPNELSELPENVHSEFPSTMAFLTCQSWCILKSWYSGRGLEQGHLRCFICRHTWQRISSVCASG